MTAESIAELLQARRVGRGRYQARCPAHDDRHPSLSIAQGERGVLVRCWSHGCTPASICAALGLTLRDLFHDDRDLTPAERAQAAQEIREREAARKAAHHAGCQHNRESLRMECLLDALGGLLARNPDDAEVARMFHGILDKLTMLEVAENSLKDGSLRQEPLPESPARIADALTEIGQDFNAKERASSQAA